MRSWKGARVKGKLSTHSYLSSQDTRLGNEADDDSDFEDLVEENL